MMVHIEKLFVMEVPDKYGENTKYLPLIATTIPLEARDDSVGVCRELMVLNKDDGIKLMEDYTEIYYNLLSYLQSLRKEGYDIYHKECTTPEALLFFVKRDMIHACKDLERLSFELIGKALLEMETIDEYTRQQQTLLLSSVDSSGRMIKKFILTTEDLENMVDSKVYSLKFREDIPLDLSHEKLFESRWVDGKLTNRLKVLANGCYIIDTNPLTEDLLKKKFFVSTHPEDEDILVCTPFAKRALKFLSEKEAADFALKNMDKIDSGGFEIVHLLGKHVVFKKSGAEESFWA